MREGPADGARTLGRAMRPRGNAMDLDGVGVGRQDLPMPTLENIRSPDGRPSFVDCPPASETLLMRG